MAAQAVYDPLSFEDILTGNNQQLFRQVGMDPKGNNEGGRIARIFLQAIWPVLAQRLAAQNQMNPEVMRAIEQVTQSLSSTGIATLADEQRARLDKQASQSGEYKASKAASAGASDLTQEGIRQMEANRATEAGNNYMNDLFSPEKMLQRATGLIDFQSGLTESPLDQTLGAANFVENRHRQNTAEKASGGLGGALGILGGILGQGSGLSGLLSSAFGGSGAGVGSAANTIGQSIGSGLGSAGSGPNLDFMSNMGFYF